jgi:transposase
MKPISNDLRRRIIDRIQGNKELQPDIAEQFSVPLSFLEKLWHRFRMTGSYEALSHRGSRKRALKEDEALIRQAVAEQPDLTLEELATRVSVETNKSKVLGRTMSEELRRLQLPRKKR